MAEFIPQRSWLILLGMTILGERLNASHFAGMLIIGLGLAAIDGRAWKAVTARTGRGNHARQHAIRPPLAR